MIVEMRTDHIEKINKNFTDQGWDERNLDKYLQEQNKGDRIVLVYEKDDQVKGYITLVKIQVQVHLRTQKSQKSRTLMSSKNIKIKA